MSPFFVEKTCFWRKKKNMFFFNNGLINSGFMSTKQWNEERQPLRGGELVKNRRSWDDIAYGRPLRIYSKDLYFELNEHKIVGTVNLLTAMGGMDMCTSHAKLLFFSTIITSVYLFSFSKLVMEIEIFHFDVLPYFSVNV